MAATSLPGAAQGLYTCYRHILVVPERCKACLHWEVIMNSHRLESKVQSLLTFGLCSGAEVCAQETGSKRSSEVPV